MSQLTFDGATHTYRYEGHVIPSVTQVIREAGMMSPFGLDDAAALFGTAVHAAILGNGNTDDMLKPYVKAWEKFLRERDLRLIAGWNERIVAGPCYRYAGRVDCVADDTDGELMVLDIKTGSPAPWHLVQVAAYIQAAVQQLDARHGVRGAVVYLAMDGDYRFRAFEDIIAIERNYQIFSDACNVWWWREKHGLRRSE